MNASSDSAALQSRERERLPEWQKQAIGHLTFRALVAAGFGMLVMGLFAALLWYFFGAHKGVDLVLVCSLPWALAALIGIPSAYRQGVRDGRTHFDEPVE
jgi:hypothetical protein